MGGGSAGRFCSGSLWKCRRMSAGPHHLRAQQGLEDLVLSFPQSEGFWRARQTPPSFCCSNRVSATCCDGPLSESRGLTVGIWEAGFHAQATCSFTGPLEGHFRLQGGGRGGSGAFGRWPSSCPVCLLWGVQVCGTWSQLWGMAGARPGSWGGAGKPLSSVATLGCTLSPSPVIPAVACDSIRGGGQKARCCSSPTEVTAVGSPRRGHATRVRLLLEGPLS